MAARYADEAEEADHLLSPIAPADERDPSRERSTDASTQSGSVSAASASIETADATDSVCSNTTGGSSRSLSLHAGVSDGGSHVSSQPPMGEVRPGDRSRAASTLSNRSGTATHASSLHPSHKTHGTPSSSITSSYPSNPSDGPSKFSTATSVDTQERRQMNEYRAEVEALVRRVVPDEIDNVDDIMVQFSGREEELIETLRSMQEKSIAQRARGRATQCQGGGGKEG